MVLFSLKTYKKIDVAGLESAPLGNRPSTLTTKPAFSVQILFHKINIIFFIRFVKKICLFLSCNHSKMLKIFKCFLIGPISWNGQETSPYHYRVVSRQHSRSETVEEKKYRCNQSYQERTKAGNLLFFLTFFYLLYLFFF